MKILVTGSSGFLGSQVVACLSKNHDVIKVDTVGECDFLGDLSDSAFVNSLPDCDAVIHCAAVQYVSKNLPILYRKRYFYRNNVLTAENIYQRYADADIHFINIGTSMMYKQNNSICYVETSSLGGEGVYSESKFQSHSVLMRFHRYSEVVPCIIGGEGREGLFVGFVKTINKFGVAIVPGRGIYRTSMVHVTDVAKLTIHILENKLYGMYNAAAFDPISINDWVDVIQRACCVNKVVKIHVPYIIVRLVGFLSFYRLLAREQIIMLGQQHIVSNQKSVESGWIPFFSNAEIVSHIAAALLGKSK